MPPCWLGGDAEGGGVHALRSWQFGGEQARVGCLRAGYRDGQACGGVSAAVAAAATSTLAARAGVLGRRLAT